MNSEFIDIISPIINHPEFLKRKKFHHHGNVTVYDHSMKVAALSYRISKKFKNVDSRSVAIGAILHDFYYRDWQSYKEKRPFFKKHGFVHAHEALLNSREYFEIYMNEKVENIIERHMFPLNIRPPKYKEAWIVSIADKIVSLETILEPTFFLKMLGF